MSTRDFYTVAHETLQCIYSSVEVAQVAHARIQAHKATDGASDEGEAELAAVIHGLERLIDQFEFRLDTEIGDTPMAIRLKTTLRGIRDLLETLRPSPVLEDLCASLEQLGVERDDRTTGEHRKIEYATTAKRGIEMRARDRRKIMDATNRCSGSFEDNIVD
ncbi:hypothetical protein P168DRAFT_278246 [Aspergillus campestris IBT 28561]|uniref:Uncharacterized protein n=1 Tax=Aspergillus campestris (strain IBT 28561) TaxID=1392248 RepID=A0A2I1DFN5_ASPC2|nr:uncharacterized protein P168DRAFT_278246 [Aspergillus campestris IBT 28561]PKY08684.1 hypothetical protein P168DRAFT_278246 [Aspergillus campestris IBT 28561]